MEAVDKPLKSFCDSSAIAEKYLFDNLNRYYPREEYWLTNSDIATIYIYSNRIKIKVGVHHFLVATVYRNDLFYVFEWGVNSLNKSKEEIYVCSEIP